MQTLLQHIDEKFRASSDMIFNKNSEIFDKIANIKNDEEMFDVIEQIAKSGKKEPDIWEDNKDFVTSDFFEPWEDNFGKSDDVYDVIERYCENNIVLGWKSEHGFKELDDFVPPIFQEITNSWDSKVIHQKMNCAATVWENRLGKNMCNLLKINIHVNYNGSDYMEYWYLFIIE